MAEYGQITADNLTRWMLDVSAIIGDAIDRLERAGMAADEAIPAYRNRYADLYKEQPTDLSVAARERHCKTEAVRERVASEKAERDLRIAEKRLNARMAQLSAFQSVASSVREEAKFTRTGPQ